MHAELGSSQVEQCALSWEVGEELGDELASWQVWQGGGGGGSGGGEEECEEVTSRGG